MPHVTKLAKVTADIDELVLPLVELFNEHPLIRTCSSCQGDPRSENEPIQDGWVNFDLQKHDNFDHIGALCDLAFRVIAEALIPVGSECSIVITGLCGTYIATLHFRTEDIGKITDLLRGPLRSWTA